MSHRLAVVIAAAFTLAAGGCSAPFATTKTLPYSDDFSGDCAWVEQDTEGARVGCEQDVYRMEVHGRDMLGTALEFSDEVDSIRVESDATVVNEPSGVAGRFTTFALGCYVGAAKNEEQGPDGPGYLFAVTSEGGYFILKDPGGGKDRVTLASEEATVPVPAGANRLSGDCIRMEGTTRLVLRLNGERVADTTDDDASAGGFRWMTFAIATNEVSADVRFDNASARALTSSEIATARNDEGSSEGEARGLQTGLAAETLPIQDDFEGACTWPQETSGGAQLSCEDGEYKLLFERPGEHLIPRRTETGYEDVGVTATTTLSARLGNDDFVLQGVACWASPRGAPAVGYVFLLGTLGNGKSGYMIARQDEADPTIGTPFSFEPLVDRRLKSAPAPGTPVDIRGECRKRKKDVQLDLYLDGARIATARDTYGAAKIDAFRAFGFLATASKAGTEVRYDDFLAEPLDE